MKSLRNPFPDDLLYVFLVSFIFINIAKRLSSVTKII